MDAIPNNPRLLFEATIRPHRSLSKTTVALIIAGMAAVSLAVSSMMLILGAWPIITLNTSVLILAATLLSLNMRAARARETILLTETTLTITTTAPNGRSQTTQLPPYWLTITLQERPGTIPKLLLQTQKTTLEIAHNLGESPKRDLAAALTRALHRYRNPRFNNPQLN